MKWVEHHGLEETLALMADRSKGPDACWQWLGVRSAGGYGRLMYGGRRQAAHRWAWIAANGREPNSKEVVRHTCDNRVCVNPAHLLIGSQRDNVMDMVARGRNYTSSGEENPMSKLTVADVRAIRYAATIGVRNTFSAQKYGVSPSLIRAVLTRLVWKDVD